KQISARGSSRRLGSAPSRTSELFMRRRFCRAVLILMAILIIPATSLPGEAIAQTAKAKKAAPKDAKKKKETNPHDARNWNIGRDPAGPVLYYGKSPTEDLSISFTCQLEAGLVRVIAYGTARGVKPGDGARLRLSNGPARLEIAAIALPNDKNP